MWLVNHPGQLAQVAEETTYSRLTLEESVILVSATKVALVDASPIIQGVIHRDIKPSNIILHNKTGLFSTDQPLTALTEPVITDFGLVRIAHSTIQTASGAVSGTPAYMSPEQAQGLKVDHRSDIYSLGIVLYELTAGHVPFEADTSWTVILKHINEPPPPIPGIQLPAQKVIDRVLAKKPDMRYQTYRELAADYMDAIGMISEANTLRMTLPSRLEPVPASEKQDKAKGRDWKRLAGFALGAFILFFCSLAALQRLSQTSTPTETATEPPAPTETLAPVEEPTPETILFPPPRMEFLLEFCVFRMAQPRWIRSQFSLRSRFHLKARNTKHGS